VTTAVVTGSAGLIGSETVTFLHDKGLDVIGVDNNLREYFFGPDGSTRWKRQELVSTLPRYRHFDLDIRDEEGINRLFRQEQNVSLVVHCAAQPSHDWAAREPMTDFTVNAAGTLVMLEATRKFAPSAVFIFMSTNKVYGDLPNVLPMVELETRWEVEQGHPYAEHGVDEGMSLDKCMHSIFGASKVAADIMTQEYGRYFGLKTGIFRGGCLTGPAHSGAELHGFLAYLIKCAVYGRPYTVHGYGGKQVRDNIHSYDLVNAFWHFYQNPRPAEAYNIGGSRVNNCSVLEAIRLIEDICGLKLNYSMSKQSRAGDHIWWVSDIRKFMSHYPGWKLSYSLEDILRDLTNSARMLHRSARS
jgi:CDP-paratose 2-epimerase